MCEGNLKTNMRLIDLREGVEMQPKTKTNLKESQISEILDEVTEITETVGLSEPKPTFTEIQSAVSVTFSKDTAVETLKELDAITVVLKQNMMNKEVAHKVALFREKLAKSWGFN
jgi:hypothetical protein